MTELSVWALVYSCLDLGCLCENSRPSHIYGVASWNQTMPVPVWLCHNCEACSPFGHHPRPGLCTNPPLLYHLHSTPGARPGLDHAGMEPCEQRIRSMPCHECVGTGGHGFTPPTGGLPCVQGHMCSHAYLRHGRAHAQAVLFRWSHVCPCNPGQHGSRWAWTQVHCLGRAHADMAQPVPMPAGFTQMYVSLTNWMSWCDHVV